MSLIRDTDTYMQYRYVVSEFKAMMGSEIIEFDTGKIRNLSIEKDYENDLFPLLRVVVITSQERYRQILRNRDTVKFKFRLQKYSRMLHDPNTESMKSDYINGTFVIFTDDDTPDMSENVVKLKQKTDDVEGEYLMQDDYEAEFYLFREDYVTKARTLCHGIMQCNLETAVAWLCSKAGIDKLMLAKMDNRESYNPLIIPQQSFIDCINFLDNWYGFYKNGAIIFFDFDCFYILNYTSKTTVWKPGEVTEGVIFILDEVTSEEQYSIQLIRQNDVKHYVTTGHNLIEIMDMSSVQDVLSGTNITVLNSADIDVRSGNASGKNTKILRTANPSYDETIYAARMEANKKVVNIALGSIDLAIVSPNKKFQLVFEDTKLNSSYGGWYKMMKIISTFTKEGEYFTVANAATFKCFDKI